MGEPARISDLAGLAPAFRAAVMGALEECRAAGLDATVFETLRTQERQRWAYLRGASRAKDADASWHFYGLAVDVISRAKAWDAGDAWFRRVAAVFKRHGCDWGGDWHSFRDLPHFQWGRCRASPSDVSRTLYAQGGREAVWRAVGATAPRDTDAPEGAAPRPLIARSTTTPTNQEPTMPEITPNLTPATSAATPTEIVRVPLRNAPQPTPKPGYRTTEFWATLVTVAGTLAVATGRVSPEQNEAVQQAVPAVVQAVAAVAAAIASVGYALGRARVKQSGAG